jgi:hypothetical protein
MAMNESRTPEAAAKPEQPQSVWFDWGSGNRDEVVKYDFPSLSHLNAFLEGVQAAADAFGADDYRQFDTLAEVDEAFAEEAAQ